MDKNQGTNQLEELVDAIFLLSVYAHIRPLFKEVGLEIDGGLVLFVPDFTRKEEVIRAFELCGCVKSQIYRNKIPAFPNYKLVMIEYQSFHNVTVIESFLGCKEYFPMLIVFGYMPENLKGFSNIVALEENVNFSFGLAKKRGDMFNEFASYSHQNADDILYTLNKFMEGDEHSEVMKKPIGYQTLYFMAKIYCYYTVSYVKAMTYLDEMFNSMIGHVENLFWSYDAGYENMEILPAVNKALADFLIKDKDVLLGHIDGVEGELLIAVKQEQAVLYDASFYYISDHLLRKATKPLREIISYPLIKLSLYQENVLLCNDVRQNYTVKKVIINSYGEIMRLRFLKLDRSKFDGEDSLSIVERRGEECTSENVTGLIVT